MATNSPTIRYTRNTSSVKLWQVQDSTIAAGGLRVSLPDLMQFRNILHAPMVINYREQATLRAVTPQRSVRKGDLLLEIHNLELMLRRDAVVAEIAKAEIQIRVAHEEQKIAEAIVLQDKIKSLKQRLTELESLVSGLKIFAPMDGEITTFDLAQRMGMYVNVGDEIVSLGDPKTLEALALVKQADIRYIDRNLKQQSRVEILGRPISDARVSSVAPRASTTLPHSAFAASHGGMLSVIANHQNEGPTPGSLNSSKIELVSSSTKTIDGISLVDPGVSVFLELIAPQTDEGFSMRSGQIGYAISRCPPGIAGMLSLWAFIAMDRKPDHRFAWFLVDRAFLRFGLRRARLMPAPSVRSSLPNGRHHLDPTDDILSKSKTKKSKKGCRV